MKEAEENHNKIQPPDFLSFLEEAFEKDKRFGSLFTSSGKKKFQSIFSDREAACKIWEWERGKGLLWFYKAPDDSFSFRLEIARHAIWFFLFKYKSFEKETKIKGSPIYYRLIMNIYKNVLIGILESGKFPKGLFSSEEVEQADCRLTEISCYPHAEVDPVEYRWSKTKKEWKELEYNRLTNLYVMDIDNFDD